MSKRFLLDQRPSPFWLRLPRAKDLHLHIRSRGPTGSAYSRWTMALQVWLSRNTDAPRVQTNIAVRAGSKNDPADARGLAHYLEHMLSRAPEIATTDWAKESAVLKRIS
ncbi:MAG: insulinase family protein [Flavobacteriales bacterium]|nr:insulinase family protein [Flavobacteriales bacterium]